MTNPKIINFQMVKVLRKVDQVNCFVLVMNGEEPRFDQRIRDMIETFTEMFGKEFLANIAIVFTLVSR